MLMIDAAAADDDDGDDGDGDGDGDAAVGRDCRVVLSDANCAVLSDPNPVVPSDPATGSIFSSLSLSLFPTAGSCWV